MRKKWIWLSIDVTLVMKKQGCSYFYGAIYVVEAIGIVKVEKCAAWWQLELGSRVARAKRRTRTRGGGDIEGVR